MIDDNGDPYNPCSAAYIGKQTDSEEERCECVVEVEPGIFESEPDCPICHPK